MIKTKNGKNKEGKAKIAGFKQLGLEERIRIELHYHGGKNFREINKLLGGRNVSTISDEIDGKPRNGHGKYSAYAANERVLIKRGERGKRPRLKSQFIIDYVVEKLKLGWSPEQISITLPIDHEKQTISHEAIYEYIYAQIGVTEKAKKDSLDLRIYLPSRHKRGVKKAYAKGTNSLTAKLYLELMLGKNRLIRAKKLVIGKMTQLYPGRVPTSLNQSMREPVVYFS